MKFIFALSILFSSFSVYATVDEQKCISESTTIEKKLACIKSLTFKEVTNQGTPIEARQFEIQFTQLVDHNNASAGTFSQRLALIHRDEAEPMVLHTGGYFIAVVKPTILAATFGTNQLQVEHRFFANSTPVNLDWSKLDIKQSADDFHEITLAFKQIYSKRWVNTGGSKGGMTSRYHRRFYPADLDGTLAAVAPLSFSTSDQRYNDFVNNVGGDNYKTCRENFRKMQIALLENRDDIVPIISASAGTFKYLGSPDLAFEHSVIESPFFFWQYGNPDDATIGCAAIPSGGTIAEMVKFLERIVPISEYNDDFLTRFSAYYYQAATQLGSPDNVTSHLEKLRRYQFSLDQYAPQGVPHPYSKAPMLDVDKWVRQKGDKIIFIYGEFDPWTAGEFPASETGKEIYRYYAPKGNHSSNLPSLSVADKTQAINLLSEWLGKKPVVTLTPLRAKEFLENAEMEVFTRYH